MLTITIKPSRPGKGKILITANQKLATANLLVKAISPACRLKVSGSSPDLGEMSAQTSLVDSPLIYTRVAAIDKVNNSTIMLKVKLATGPARAIKHKSRCFRFKYWGLTSRGLD